MNIQLYTAQLYHHGVKGMKWGVRKEDRDIRVRAGSKIQRVSTSDERQKDLNRKHAYVSTNRKDRKVYGKTFAKELARDEALYKNNPTQVYRIRYKAKNDLISPSKNKRIEEFNKLKKDSKIQKETIKSLKTEFHGGNSAFSRMTNEQVSDYLKKASPDEQYYAFSFSILSSKYNRDKYFNILQKQGYNALIDDVDAGSYSEAPMIVFNRYKDLEYKKAKVIVDKYKP